MKFAEVVSVAEYFKMHAVSRGNRFAGHPLVFFGETVRVNRTKRLVGGGAQGRARRLGVAPDHHPAITRNKIDKSLEGELVRCEIGVDIRVIEFERCNDQIVGMIVKEFGAAIPESSFVFIAFKNHLTAVTEAVAFAN